MTISIDDLTNLVITDQEKNSPIFFKYLTQYLKEDGDINANNRNGYPLIVEATIQNKTDIIKHLLAKGAKSSSSIERAEHPLETDKISDLELYFFKRRKN